MEWRSDTRAVSTLTEILLWGIVGLVALIVLLTLVSVAVSVVISLLTILVPIVLLGAIIYLAIAYLTGDDSSTPAAEYGGYEYDTSGPVEASTESTPAPQDPHDRLTEQYVRGEISEEEYERRISEYLDSSSGVDAERSRDREFER